MKVQTKNVERKDTEDHAGNSTRNIKNTATCLKNVQMQSGGPDTIDNLWFLDSGSSHHISNDRSDFKILNDFNDKIVWGTNLSCKVEGRGIIEAFIDGDKSNGVRLLDALLVPNFKMKILSLGAASRNNWNFVIKENVCIGSINNVEYLTAKRNNENMYSFNMVVEKSSSDSVVDVGLQALTTKKVFLDKDLDTKLGKSPKPKRRKRKRKKKRNHQIEVQEEWIPKTYAEALQCNEKEGWEKAIKEEVESITNMKVWIHTDRPTGKKVLRPLWKFKKKFDEKDESGWRNLKEEDKAKENVKEAGELVFTFDSVSDDADEVLPIHESTTQTSGEETAVMSELIEDTKEEEPIPELTDEDVPEGRAEGRVLRERTLKVKPAKYSAVISGRDFDDKMCKVADQTADRIQHVSRKHEKKSRRLERIKKRKINGEVGNGFSGRTQNVLEEDIRLNIFSKYGP
jgi:hypothetical protein